MKPSPWISSEHKPEHIAIDLLKEFLDNASVNTAIT
jgi:hypothetical protein